MSDFVKIKDVTFSLKPMVDSHNYVVNKMRESVPGEMCIYVDTSAAPAFVAVYDGLMARLRELQEEVDSRIDAPEWRWSALNDALAEKDRAELEVDMLQRALDSRHELVDGFIKERDKLEREMGRLEREVESLGREVADLQTELEQRNLLDAGVDFVKTFCIGGNQDE